MISFARRSEVLAPPQACAAVTPARVGSGALCQHAIQTLDEGAVFLLASALSTPRLWDYLLAGALEGFHEGYARPHDGRVSTRLHQGMLVAQQNVRRRVEHLLERRMSDVGLLALAREGQVLHVLSAGPSRAYLFQAKTLRALGPQDEAPDGLLKVTPSWSAEQIYAGDLVFATPVHPGSDAELRSVRAALSGPVPTPERLVALLNEPARSRGKAAAAIALQVPIS